MRKKREQITMDFPKELRLRMKIQAIKHNMTMREWMICIISKEINRQLELEK